MITSNRVSAVHGADGRVAVETVPAAADQETKLVSCWKWAPVVRLHFQGCVPGFRHSRPARVVKKVQVHVQHAWGRVWRMP